MLDKVQQYITDYKLFDKHNTVLIGISGGADSVALLDVLHSLNYKCIAAHCNFHLRDEESNCDQLFVENLIDNYGIKLHTIDFDTELYAQENSISIEMAARELRYNWFESLLKQYNIDCIAVAHHRDDSAETVLLNLIRGTGIRGLSGIKPINGNIVRPLLSISRDEIEEYLKNKGIEYVNDSTNSEDIYTRNKIRLNILPLMETINPSVKQSIADTSEHLKQVENIYLDYINRAKNNLFQENQINISKLKTYLEPQAILFEILSSYGFNGDTVRNIFQGLDNQSGQIYYSNTHELLKDRYSLILKEKGQENFESILIDQNTTLLSSPIALQIEKIKNDKTFKIEKNKNIVYLDADLVAYPLILRRWKPGDWFIPFGMKGTKKLSDYFSDEKFSIFEKEATYLICTAENILWIVGHRSDNRYKITEATQNILKISLT